MLWLRQIHITWGIPHRINQKLWCWVNHCFTIAVVALCMLACTVHFELALCQVCRLSKCHSWVMHIWLSVTEALVTFYIFVVCFVLCNLNHLGRLAQAGFNFYIVPFQLSVCVCVIWANSNMPKPIQSDVSFSTVLTYQAWTGTSASGTSSPGPSAAPRWRWCGCGAASSGGACCAPFPTRCWCWGASGLVRARSIADAAARARAGARRGRRQEMAPGGGGGAAVWSLRGEGRHVATRSLEEQTETEKRNKVRCKKWVFSELLRASQSCWLYHYRPPIIA